VWFSRETDGSDRQVRELSTRQRPRLTEAILDDTPSKLITIDPLT
jgi:hypothetical protein